MRGWRFCCRMRLVGLPGLVGRVGLVADRVFRDLVVQRHGFAHRLDRQFLAQRVATTLELAQRQCTLAVAQQQPHQFAVDVFTQQVVVENALGVADRAGMVTGQRAQLHQAAERVQVMAAQALALAHRPFVAEAGQDVVGVTGDAPLQVVEVARREQLDRLGQRGHDEALEVFDVQHKRRVARHADGTMVAAREQVADAQRSTLNRLAKTPQGRVEAADRAGVMAFAPQGGHQLAAGEELPARKRQIGQQAARPRG